MNEDICMLGPDGTKEDFDSIIVRYRNPCIVEYDVVCNAKFNYEEHKLKLEELDKQIAEKKELIAVAEAVGTILEFVNKKSTFEFTGRVFK